MRKVIDLECDLPPDEAGNPRKLESATHPPGHGDPERLAPLPGHGFSNYQRIFTRRTDGGASAGAEKKHGMSIAAFVALMDRAGVEVGLLRAGNQLIADVLAQYPRRFIGLATISPHDGMRGVRENVGAWCRITALGRCGFRHSTTWSPPATAGTTRSMRNAWSSTSPCASTAT
jgi:hypothetical protein